MIKIGITGGIGSGKTTICNLLEKEGFPIYYADEKAKEIMKCEAVKSKIELKFGNNSYLPNGELNRSYLSEIVFNNQTKLDELNGIVHPAVKNDFIIWCLDKEKNGKNCILKEAAIMFESDSHKDLDYIILITASKAIRIKRIMNRDHMIEEEIKQRMSKQYSDEIKEKMSDFIVVNDGTRDLIKIVDEIKNKIESWIILNSEIKEK